MDRWRGPGCLLLAAALACPRIASALAGAPPFDWFVTGPLAPEYEARFSARPEVGAGGRFAGGDGPSSLQVRDYVAAPVRIQYGLWRGLEAYMVLPLYWGRSPQRLGTSLLPSGPSFQAPARVEVRADLSGFDAGDPAVGLRVLALSRGEREFVVAAGTGFPLGFDVWRGFPRFNYFRSAPGVPELAYGDGAFKALVAAEVAGRRDDRRYSALAGYVHKFPFRADLLELGSRDRVRVRLPSPLLARLETLWVVSPAWWAGGRVEGYWAGAGSIRTEPEVIRDRVDNYANLARARGALWAGAEASWEPSDIARVRLGLDAPALAHRTYRYWRVRAVVEYLWSP